MVATTNASVSRRATGSTTAIHKGWEVNLLTAGELRVRLFGEWVLESGARSSAELSRRLGETPRPTKISFDVSGTPRAIVALEATLLRMPRRTPVATAR